MNESNDSRVEYPAFEVGGLQYGLKFDTGALYRLSKLGVKASDLAKLDEGDIATVLAVAVAVMGVANPDGGWTPIAKTPEQLADMVPLHRLGELSEAIGKASSKASLAANGDAQPGRVTDPQQ